MNQRIFTAVAVVAALAACGGGGGGGSTVPAGTSSGPTAVSTPTVPAVVVTAAPNASAVRLTILVPAAKTGSSARKAQFVDPSTQAISLQLLAANGAAATGAIQGPFGLTATSPGCTSTSAGTSCVLQINAPVGDDIFSATTFNSTGQSLGSGAFRVTVASNASNTASLTLNGPLTSVSLTASSFLLANGGPDYRPTATPAPTAPPSSGPSSAPSTAPTATPAPAYLPTNTSIRIFAVGLDNATPPNIIINPTLYNQPIVLKLALNGGPANVTLAVAYASGEAASGTLSTSADGGTLTLYSPSDQITLTQSATGPAGQSTPTVSAYIASVGNPVQSSLNVADYYTVNPGPLSVSPTSLNLGSTAQTVTVTDPGLFANVSVVTSNCSYYNYEYYTSYVTLNLTTMALGPANGYSSTFTVTPGNPPNLNTSSPPSPLPSPAACTITVSDQFNPSVTIPVTVTRTTVSGS